MADQIQFVKTDSISKYTYNYNYYVEIRNGFVFVNNKRRKFWLLITAGESWRFLEKCGDMNILFILLSNIFSYFFFRKSEAILNNYHINLN